MAEQEILTPQVIDNNELTTLGEFRDGILEKKELREQETATNIASILEVVGMKKTHEISEQFNKTLLTVKLQQIKHRKEYKGLTLINMQGQPVTINTWAEFCRNLDMSEDKVDKDIENLNIFGQKFMQLSETLGLSYRELRRMRQNMQNPMLTEQEKLALSEAKQKDPQELLGMLEDLQDKQASLEDKQTTLEKTVKELKKENEAKTELIKHQSERINTLSLVETEAFKQEEKNRLFNYLEREFANNINLLQNAKVAFLEVLRLQENGELDEQENDRFDDSVLQFLTNVMRFSSEVRSGKYNFLNAADNLGLLPLFSLYIEQNTPKFESPDFENPDNE